MWNHFDEKNINLVRPYQSTTDTRIHSTWTREKHKRINLICKLSSNNSYHLLTSRYSDDSDKRRHSLICRCFACFALDDSPSWVQCQTGLLSESRECDCVSLLKALFCTAKLLPISTHSVRMFVFSFRNGTKYTGKLLKFM